MCTGTSRTVRLCLGEATCHRREIRRGVRARGSAAAAISGTMFRSRAFYSTVAALASAAVGVVALRAAQAITQRLAQLQEGFRLLSEQCRKQQLALIRLQEAELMRLEETAPATDLPNGCVAPQATAPSPSGEMLAANAVADAAEATNIAAALACERRSPRRARCASR